jgi:twitching motility protein PilT
VFADRKGRGAVFRVIPTNILTAEKLGLSQYILNLCKLNKGLVLVTGPAGSDKSTTLCAMIDYVNRTRDEHILTTEDPNRVRASESAMPHRSAGSPDAYGLVQSRTTPTVDRIIDQFPSDRQSQSRIMLSESLRGVIA